MAIEQRLVLLLDAESRMCHPESNVAVVRQEQQAGRVAIEAADRNDPLGDIDQVEDGATTPLVARRRDVAIGLVEQDVAPPLVLQRLPIDPDILALRVDLNAQLGDDLAVDGHPALTDQVFRLAARGDAVRCQDTL